MPHDASAIERVAVEALLPYAANARTHSDEQVAQIAASIAEFGFTAPCLVDERGVLIAGHGRLLAARRLGLHDVPAIRLAHLTDAQARAYRISFEDQHHRGPLIAPSPGRGNRDAEPADEGGSGATYSACSPSRKALSVMRFRSSA